MSTPPPVQHRLIAPHRSALRWVAAGVLAAAAVACGGGTAESGSEGAVSAQRAPKGGACAFDHVYLTVTGVRALQQTSAGWKWLDIALAAPVRIDLLATGDGLLRALGAAPLAAGRYREVRLLLAEGAAGSGNAVQPTGGNEAALAVPSGAHSGWKLHGDVDVPAGRTGDLVLQEFDPCDSLVRSGNGSSARYRLKPEAAARVQLAADATAAPTASAAFRVSAPGATFQAWPRAARLADGGVVIAWHALGQGLCSRVYESGGASRNAPSCVESPNAQAERPALAALAGGGYVIGWSVALGNNTWSLRSQRYDAGGAAIAGIQSLVTPAGSIPTQVTAAGLAGGGYVIGWQGQQYPASANIHARRFADDGAPIGGQFQVNSPEGGSAGINMPGVAALAGGGYVFVWNGGGARVYARQFSAAGVPTGTDRLVTAQAPFPFQPVAVAGLAGGGHVVAWNAGGAVDAQRFGPDGAAMGEPTRVEPLPPVDPSVICGATPQGPTPCSYREDLPDVAALADGGFVVVYEYQGLPWTDDAKVIHGRRFLASGSAAGPAIRISDPATVAAKAASRPAVAPTGSGGFIAAWQYQSSEMAIFARDFSGAALRATRP